MSEETEFEEKPEPVVENSEGNASRKGKFLTLLFQPEGASTEGKEAKKDKNNPPSKVVIRRLPPRLSKEAFLEEFSPLPNYDFFYFVRGDLSLGTYAFSRAYIHFLNEEDIFAFKEKFDDYGIRDEKGKAYHAVVEFAPFQKVPRRFALKKVLSKAGTLESDPKYTEFLQKLEDLRTITSNTSEYFHETEDAVLKTKVTTTPLLEYLKQKKQKKIDLKNEIRQRKREAEKERKRKEDEKRKAEREKRREEKAAEKKSGRADEKKCAEDKIRRDEHSNHKKVEEKGRWKEDKKDLKKARDIENENSELPSESVIPNDPAILKVVLRQSEKDGKASSKEIQETAALKLSEGEPNVKSDMKYSDFRLRLVEEKQKKTFHRRELDESKQTKGSTGSRKGVPDEKGDNYNIGNCPEINQSKSSEFSKRPESKIELKEAKSKFRYSEQRNRDREYRNLKPELKNQKDSLDSDKRTQNKLKNTDSEKSTTSDTGKEHKVGNKDEADSNKSSKNSEIEKVPYTSRRKSFELDREVIDGDRKRSKSFHDVSNKGVSDIKLEKRGNGRGGDGNVQENETSLSYRASKGNIDCEKLDEDSKKDPRIERRIRNKDRPSIEIYRPGMGKFSKQRLEQKKDDSACTSPTGTPLSNRSNSLRGSNKSNNKKSAGKNDSTEKSIQRNEEAIHKSASTSSKITSEVKTMTFTRSVSKEN